MHIAQRAESKMREDDVRFRKPYGSLRVHAKHQVQTTAHRELFVQVIWMHIAPATASHSLRQEDKAITSPSPSPFLSFALCVPASRAKRKKVMFLSMFDL